jgi:hypothetical protein
LSSKDRGSSGWQGIGSETASPSGESPSTRTRQLPSTASAGRQRASHRRPPSDLTSTSASSSHAITSAIPSLTRSTATVARPPGAYRFASTPLHSTRSVCSIRVCCSSCAESVTHFTTSSFGLPRGVDAAAGSMRSCDLPGRIVSAGTVSSNPASICAASAAARRATTSCSFGPYSVDDPS